eukprot:CAMPEP_0174275554 /NCGR_PEP_ID=MMETSP0439-20130205/59890_1 /TAXON_ID=0 /ORGANISM="Stereomyxa ramosa, Strain Chinc5" /LENGTH=666 /DNA_ID=CAMNT_0015367671 /DNA_START=134 /DNA_END=2134 /DNA_ORIENTATION=+
MSDDNNQYFREENNSTPERVVSAPPVLEVQESSLFAAGNNYAHFFTTNQEENEYAQYNSYYPDDQLGNLEEYQYPENQQAHASNEKHYVRNGGPEGYPAEYLQRWNQPMPKRLTSISSLEEYPTADSLIPELSSDSESVCSSVEDISLLVQNLGFSNEELYHAANQRYLWEEYDGIEILDSNLRRIRLNPELQMNGMGNPNGFMVNSVEQALGEAEVAVDMPLQRRREPRRGQNSTVPCRYFAQGYCSRGDRCNFAHIRTEEDWPEPSPLPVPKPRKPKSNTTTSITRLVAPARHLHRRSHSEASSFSHHNFIMGTNTLGTNAGRFTSIEQVIGQIYPMCKDQHGCRFLQKKLDEENVQITDTIFNEVYPHFAELMTDPFGNYLCQKLLEHCSQKQRIMLIESVAGSLVRVSQNMHGTRAVQKMIECLQSPEEVKLVTRGLRSSVVLLIKDLNGNHVVQRCLNHLSSEDNQFIYDAVAGHCVEVATHRHGCCVLQRCIDHASDQQKLQLVTEITSNALTLVKDPYGNYVVQYVLDLPYPPLIANLVLEFKTHLAELSTQKFSSNVVEKCLKVSGSVTRSWMIKELAEMEFLKNLIQDPFGNYVIQTAMSVSDPVQHMMLVEGIKPFLYSLRNTPYGKRIQNKILKDAQQEKRAQYDCNIVGNIANF